MTEPNEGTGDPRLQAEGELSMARLALDGGDLRHAADHVARAVASDPTLPEIHELLARLANHPEGGLELFPLGQSTYLGTVVCRAHVLASRGSVAEALPLLVSAQRYQPDGAWAEVAWMYDPGLGERLTPDEAFPVIHQLVQTLADPVPPENRPALRPYLTLVRSLLAAHPRDARLLWSTSILMRRCGESAEAVDLALRSEAVEPSFYATLALGYAYRAERRWAEAEQAWLRALRHQPDNLALQTDIGELLATAGRPDDGLAWVEQALRTEPDHPSAYPTACGLRFDRDGDLGHLVALADHLRDNPDNGHADGVLSHRCDDRWWLGRLPGPTESVINLMWQVLTAEHEVTPSGAVAVSAPEPPSALLAFGRALPAFTVDISGVPEPDPRRPVPEVFDGGSVRAVHGQLWAFDGTTPRPVPRPPSESAAATVREVAARGWRHPVNAYDAAVRLSDLELSELLGALVHPPQPPVAEPGVWPEWVRRVQVWTCLGIAHHRADEPWPSSVRRAMLVDLAYGPEDWASEAALFALVATAWTQPDTRADVAELVGWRFLAAVRAASTRAVTVLESVAHLVCATPGMDPEVRSLAEDVVKAEREGEEGGGAES